MGRIAKGSHKDRCALVIRDAALNIVRREGIWEEAMSGGRTIRVLSATFENIKILYTTPFQRLPERSDAMKYDAALRAAYWEPSYWIDIWESGRKVFFVEWENDQRLSIVSFHRGAWEQRVLDRFKRLEHPVQQWIRGLDGKLSPFKSMPSIDPWPLGIWSQVTPGVSGRPTWSSEAIARLITETIRTAARNRAIAQWREQRTNPFSPWLQDERERTFKRLSEAFLRPLGPPLSRQGSALRPGSCPPPAQAARIEVEVAGAVVRIPSDANARTITTVIRALKSAR